MNTTESDLSIDTLEEVHEIVTNDLRGEKIERLLYKAGFDSEHKLGDEGVTVLEVQGDGVLIVVSETWEADGEWYLDPSTVVLDKFVDHERVDTTYPSVYTEEELVEAIENFSE